MDKYICIHGHFYQPPRENPWLNAVEVQDSAYPYHDWNERITAECYARNAASRILNNEGKITDIINNYTYISFNFGPTLLEWMEKNAPEAYEAILDADRQSRKRFSGHGSALAQAYNHIILPLANKKDRQTQISWGIKDFEHRFGRKPEGMWLAETAANTAALEELAAQGIKFTILSPYQALRYRKIGDKSWKDATGAKIDPRRPYRCNLPSGNHIDLFFYDGPVSQGIAFEGLLNSGEAFAKRLVNQLDNNSAEPQLMHIATDGETYGHHHKLGEMALSYCLHHIEEDEPAKITIYGEYLEKFPPAYEVEIIEDSSWSCAHGVERWRSNCGCNTGGRPDWNQEWRAPLRDALDWLRERLKAIYEDQLSSYSPDPWELRNHYIDVVLDRSEANVERFFRENFTEDLQQQEKIKILKLLEMQYHAMLMYTSCGWFFDELTGIETMQDILYAARAIQLATDVSGLELEDGFLEMLEKAKPNDTKYANGRVAYNEVVKPAVLDLRRVGAHYGVSSLFREYPEVQQLYSYTAHSDTQLLLEAGRESLILGRATLKSRITWEEDKIAFAILHLGDHNMFGGVREFGNQETYLQMEEEIKSAFEKSNVFEVVMLMDKHFGSHNYSFWHLFKDDQKKVLNQVLQHNTEDIERQFTGVYENNYSLMQAIYQMDQELPKALKATVDFVINIRFRKLLEEPVINTQEIRKLLGEIKRIKGGLDLDVLTLNFIGSEKITSLVRELYQHPDNNELLVTIKDFIFLLREAGLEPDLWWVQNIAYKLKQERDRKPVLTGIDVTETNDPLDNHYKIFFDLLNIKS